jgi:eukaryotic-like serine/threonine-protein kinase
VTHSEHKCSAGPIAAANAAPEARYVETIRVPEAALPAGESSPHRPGEPQGDRELPESLAIASDGRYDFHPSGAPDGRELGRGGLGRVLIALDRTLGREVAVKELLPELAHRDAVARFVREARITGQLEHPNIVPVYEMGTGADGLPYYTMRVVRGRTLDEALDAAPGLLGRLSLLHHYGGICQAIAYAHSRGVVHRDIKPQNVMIGEFGETIVLDWGIAKVRGDVEPDNGSEFCTDASSQRRLRAIGDAAHTAAGRVLGTPAYMSPEQAIGQVDDVDERSDVWALGAVLYRLLTGQVPFEASTLPALLRSIGVGKLTPVRAFDPAIPADLAAIAERALRKNKQDRYQNAGELLRDVLAYQSGARVDAYDYSSIELLRRFVAKNRNAVVVSALAAVILLVFGVLGYRRLIAARDRAVSAEQQARHSASQAQANLAEAFADKATMALVDGDLVGAGIFSAKALSLEERADARGISVALSSKMLPIRSAQLNPPGDCQHFSYSFGAVSWRCAAARTLFALEAASGKVLASRATPADVTALAGAADASPLVFGLADGRLGSWRAPASSDLPTWPAHGTAVTAIAVDARGAVAVSAADRAVTIWDLAARTSIVELRASEPVTALSVSPDGERVAIGGRFGEVLLWRRRDAGLPQRLEPHAGTVLAFAFSRDGQKLASSSTDRTIRLRSATTGDARASPIVVQSPSVSLAWSADGQYLACGSEDYGVRLHPMRGRSASILLKGHESAVTDVQFSTDSSQIATSSRNKGLMVWRLSKPAAAELDHRSNVLALRYTPSGREIVSAGLGDQGACIWQVGSGACQTRLPIPIDRVRAMAISPDGKWLALGGSGGKVFLWDLALRVPTRVLLGHEQEVRALAFSPEGKLLASASVDQSARIWDVANGHQLRSIRSAAALNTIAFAGPRRLVTGNRAGQLELFSVEDGARQNTILAHTDWIMDVAVTKDVLVSAGADRSISLRNAHDGAPIANLRTKAGRVLSVDVSPDGETVVTGAEDRTVRLWSVRTHAELARLDGHEAAVRSVRFAPDGRVVASGSDDGTIRFWSLSALTIHGGELLRRAELSGMRLSGTQLTPAR